MIKWFISCFYYQGFVAAVKHMRSFVPAVYDVTFAVSKGHALPSLVRILEKQPCEVLKPSCMPVIINISWSSIDDAWWSYPDRLFHIFVA